MTVRHVTPAALVCVMCGAVAASPQSNAQSTTGRPCSGQAKTLVELRRAFNAANLPSPARITGTWVGIGVFGSAESHGSGFAKVDCNGFFQEVLRFDGYAVKLEMTGAIVDKEEKVQPDTTSSVTFPAPGAGDAASPVFRCRLTKRDTLACLIDVYQEGYEFRRMSPAE